MLAMTTAPVSTMPTRRRWVRVSLIEATRTARHTLQGHVPAQPGEFGEGRGTTREASGVPGVPLAARLVLLSLVLALFAVLFAALLVVLGRALRGLHGGDRGGQRRLGVLPDPIGARHVGALEAGARVVDGHHDVADPG